MRCFYQISKTKGAHSEKQTMPFIPVRNLQMYFEIRGKGPRLLVISSRGGDLRRSPNIFKMPIAQHFEILAYDQRGVGQTSKPDIPYSMVDYAEDANVLLNEVGWDCCLVMGISFGGMVAQEFALMYPYRLERLVLACTSSGGAGGNSYPLHDLMGLSPEDYVCRILQLRDIRKHSFWRETNPDQFQKLFDETLASLQVGIDEPGHQVGALRQLEARARHDTYDRLPRLQIPVYICGGLYDGIAKPSNLKAMHEQIPGSRLELFDGGHLFYMEDPRAFDRITAFLRGNLNP